MSPELRHFRYFIAVAEELHFGRAARRLNIAQPPLSKQIGQLERAVGARLLIRSTRRVELTPAGRVFLEAARSALAQAERAGEAARRASHGRYETLRVGFTEAATFSILPRTIASFRDRSPEVHLDLVEDASAASLLDAVRDDRVDVALMRGPVEARGLEVRRLLEERFWVALPASHRLAGRKRVSLAALAEDPFVFFPRRSSPAYHDQLLTLFQSAGVTPNIAFEVARYTTFLAIVAAGCGVSLIPRSNRSLEREGVVYRELTGAGADATAVLVAVHRPDEPSLALAGLLAEAEARVASRRATAPHRRTSGTPDSRRAL